MESAEYSEVLNRVICLEARMRRRSIGTIAGAVNRGGGGLLLAICARAERARSLGSERTIPHRARADHLSTTVASHALRLGRRLPHPIVLASNCPAGDGRSHAGRRGRR